MRKWTVRAAQTALIAAAIAAAGSGIANADNNRGDHSLLGGQQLNLGLPVTLMAPISLTGNHVNALNGISLLSGSRLAGGNGNIADERPAVTVCGNAISTAHGIGTAACKGRAIQAGADEAAAPVANACTPCAAPAPAAAEVAPAIEPASAPGIAPAIAPEPPAPAQQNGMTVGAPVGQIGAPGAPMVREAPAIAEAPAAKDAQEAPAAESASAVKEAPAAPIVDAQAAAPVRTPINICGNAGALGGVATAACEGTASSRKLGGHTAHAMSLVGLFG